MITANSLQDRLARVRHRQAHVLSGGAAREHASSAESADTAKEVTPSAGAAPAAAGPDVAPANPTASLPSHRGARHLQMLDRQSHLYEFEWLLQAVARHYGYSDADVDLLRTAVSADTPAGRHELELCVHQWRIDVVTHGLDNDLPEEVAHRALSLFRMDVMGESADENGRRHAPALEVDRDPGAVMPEQAAPQRGPARRPRP